MNRLIVVAINPGSLLASKMVKEGFGVDGKDIRIGADILVRAALSNDFSNSSGQYFDNDYGRFLKPHLDVENEEKVSKLMQVLDDILLSFTVK